MNKLRKIIAVAVAASMLLATGCTGTGAGGGKVKLTVYLHNAGFLQDFAPYLQEAVPDVDLEFTVGRDSTDFYLFKQQNGDLPDIMLRGSLAPRDSAELSEYLLDLSETETASSFYDTYLESCREKDGSVKWLPSSCIANGLLANTDLFEQYNIPLPTDYESFAYACNEFKKVGVMPYTSDFKYNYTCLYTLQGMAIPTLMSREGTAWRRNYENFVTDKLDADVWGEVFKRFERLANDAGLSAEDTERGYTMTYNAFKDGEVAMVRGMSSELANFSQYHGTTLLPYFGGTEDDNWLLTTPMFYTSLNRDLDQNTKKRDAALKVLDAMYSQAGHDILSKTYGMTLPYNRGVTAEIPEEFENLAPVINSNHMYILMTSTGLNAAALASIQGYLKGEYDINKAFEVMNSSLADAEKSVPETVITLEKGYSDEFDKNGGRQAASAIANTMRKISGSDALLAPSAISTGSLYACGYSYEMLDAAFQSSGNRIYTAEVTGAEIRELVKTAVEGCGTQNDPFSDRTLPVVSGMNITVEKTAEGYRLTDISLSDKELSDTETYTFDLVDIPTQGFPLLEKALGEGSPDRFTMSDKQAHIVWADYIAEGNQPEEPTTYIKLK